MRPLDKLYSEAELANVANAMQRFALADPQQPKFHVYVNQLRLSIVFDEAKNKFRCYVGAPLTSPTDADFAMLRASFRSPGSDLLMPRQYLHTGVLYYAYGFTWHNGPVPEPTIEARSTPDVSRDEALQKQFV